MLDIYCRTARALNHTRPRMAVQCTTMKAGWVCGLVGSINTQLIEWGHQLDQVVLIMKVHVHECVRVCIECMVNSKLRQLEAPNATQIRF